MRVTGGKILLTGKEDKSVNGIYMPETATGKRTFTVAEVGPGLWNPLRCERVPVSVKKGDRVVVDVSLAPEITISKGGVKQKYYIIPESEIQFILDEGEA